MTTSTVLQTAADLLEAKGWTQDSYLDDDGCMCMIGAVVVAAGGEFKLDDDGKPEDFVPQSEVYAAIAVIDDVLNGPAEVSSLKKLWTSVEWNDSSGRTRSEVLNVLRHAAKVAP